MNFNHDIGTIDTVLTLDTTETPALGGVSGILTVLGTGAITMPIGSTANRPVTPVNGMIRYNTDLAKVEFYENNTWVQESGGTVTSVDASGGTTGLSFSGGPVTTSGTLTLSGTLGVANGGTGSNVVPTNGQILVGNGTSFVAATLATGTGISTTVGAGTLQVNNTGVTSFTSNTGLSANVSATGAVTVTNTGVISITGTANQITASAGTGAVTLSLPSTVSVTNLDVTSLTPGGALYVGAGGALTSTAALTNGQILIGSTGVAPVAATLTAGTGVSIVNGAGTITIANTGVTSVAATTTSTGLSISGSPITTTGTLTFSLNTELQGLASLATTGLVARTGTGSYTPVTIVGTASDISVTNGNGVAGNPTIDLVSVGTPVSNSFVSITTDSKGRVIATSAATASNITTALGYTPVNKAGDTVAGTLTFSGGATITGLPTPVNPSDAAPKSYVDSAVAGLSWKEAASAATTADLGSVTYANGTAGVGATLTNAGTQAAFVVDGYTANVGDRILVKNETNQTYNGIYTVTTTGSGTTNWVLTRASDANTGAELFGATIYIDSGTVNANTGWTQTTTGALTIGTSNITWNQFSGSGAYTAGTGLTLTGNTFSLTSPVATNLGGTGLTTTPANGQLLIGNGAGYTLATLTGTAGQIGVANASGAITLTNLGVLTNVAGTGISVSGATGNVTISNTGVTSITGTANQITASASTGAVTLSLPTTLNVSSITASSITDSSLTANGIVYAGTGGLLSSTAAATNGQILIGSTGAAPSLSTITAGAAISIVNGAGTITINNTGVTSAVAGTGIGVSSGTGAVTFTNTGVTSIVAGTGISISGGTGAVTVTNSGVTSVALTAPSFLTVSGSPVTTTGTLALTLATQLANTVFAGPTTGAAAAPTFRSLVYADVVGSTGALKLYAENASTLTAPSATGTNASAFGSGAVSYLPGGKTFANGFTTTAGDAQTGLYVVRGTTTDATPNVELFLDGAGASQRMVLPTNSLWTFEAMVAARRTDATGTGGGFRLVGVIRKDTTAASTALVGAISETVIGRVPSGLNCTAVADTTNGSLKIEVTGIATNTIKWVAVVRTTEVTN